MDDDLKETKQQDEAQSAPVFETRKSSKNKIIVAILVIILLGSSIFGTWWYLNSSKNTTNQQNAGSKVIDRLRIASVDGPFDGSFPGSQSEPGYYLSDYYLHVNTQTSEGLVGYENVTKIVPRLATSWENPDENTWVFTLKKGVKFHTGRTMTADDVVYSLNKARELDTFNIYAGRIESVKALSKNKVEIKTDGPDAILLNKLTLLAIIDSNEKDGNSLTAGTGAFTLKKGTKPKKDHVELSAFNDYHGGKVMTRELVFYVVDSEATIIKEIKNKKADIGGEFISREKIGSVDDSLVHVEQGEDVAFLTLNTLKIDSPLAKKEVREAIRYALDKKGLAKAEDIESEPINQPVTKVIPGYNPDIPDHKQDITKAKELMKAAGYENGLNLSLHATSHEEVGLFAAELKKQLELIGIDLTYIPIDDFDNLLELIIEGKTEISTISYVSDTYDSLDVYESVTRGVSQYQSPQLDEYLEGASSSFDEKKRLGILKKTAKYIDDQVVTIPLYNRTYFWLYDKSKYSFKEDMATAGLGVYYWKAQLK